MTKILIGEFETYCKERLGLSEHSLRAYAQDLRAFRGYLALEKVVAWPSQTDVIGYQKHLRECRMASPTTIRRRFITLKSYFAWLQGIDASALSPLIGLRMDLKLPKRLPRPVDRPTLTALFHASKGLIEPLVDEGLVSERTYCTKQITGLVTRLLVVAGMRIRELTGLEVGDVSGSASRIRVKGKGNRERTVYVANERLLMAFPHYWEQRYRHAGSSAWLFIN